MISYAAVICPRHGSIDISYDEYKKQMREPGEQWKCPRCRQISEFDDDRYDQIHDQE